MRRSTASSFLAALFLIAAACGSGDDGEAPETSTTSTTTSTTTVTTTIATTTTGAEPGEPGRTPSLTPAAGWKAIEIDDGIKPVLALDSTGAPAIAYLIEAEHGSIRYAAQSEGWEPEVLIEGYFYGPIGLDFDPGDRPNVAYHDHQAPRVDLELGDLVHTVRAAGGWEFSTATDDGHDGWDSTIAIGTDGVVRAAGVDPQQFGSSVGVEYYELRDGQWIVTPIGSGPIEYEWNVSLALDPGNAPGISYFDNNTRDLMFARLQEGAWQIETVVSEGDTGRFSSLQFDSAGRPHISYFHQTGPSEGVVRYATHDGESWRFEEVGVLQDVEIGHFGARRITSLVLDAEDRPHVAFSDRSVVRYVFDTASGWVGTDVATAGDRPLGQLVSLALDAGGGPHVALFEVTSPSPLDGVIVYVTRE